MTTILVILLITALIRAVLELPARPRRARLTRGLGGATRSS
ncbi:hypothetical protein [Nocardioides lijunqiniae]|nr:hypothetical protein [Nocardioides lijunqiniae]